MALALTVLALFNENQMDKKDIQWIIVKISK